MTQPLPRLTLRPGKEQSLQRRHPWVFSGAISRADRQPQEGDLVDLYTSTGDFIARGHCGIGSIAVRILTFDPAETIDPDFWHRRLQAAYRLRQTLRLTDTPSTTCYRLVHGEGDNLPGLVIDIYGTTAVIQAHSVGMYLVRHQLAHALRTIYGPDRLRAVYDKSSGTLPPKSGLDPVDSYLWRTDDPTPHPLDPRLVLENSHPFRADWEGGQKTGFFLDQRDNRALVGHYARGRRVLNTFCYTGGFSVYALRGGALSVDSVDSSEKAIRLCTENIALSTPTVSHRELVADALDYVRQMPPDAYDLVILDPPAFAKHQKALPNALQGYKRLNAAALEKMPAGSLLFTFSCSQAVSREQFRLAVFSAAAQARRRVRILHQLTQPADHPVNIYHPEGEYLKGLVLYVE